MIFLFILQKLCKRNIIQDMSNNIVVIGSFMQDLIWEATGLPNPGQTVIGHLRSGPGGKGSNQAIAARRAGGAVCFIGSVGKDSYSNNARCLYETEGIRYHLEETSETPSGTAAIIVDEKGENQIVVDLGANENLSSSEIIDKEIKSANMLICQFESNLTTTIRSLKIARKSKTTTILNPAPMRSNVNLDFLTEVDIIVPNENEFFELTQALGIKTPRCDILKFPKNKMNTIRKDIGTKVLIITLGDRGSLLCTENSYIKIDPIHLGKAIDTTGAGDAYVGGLGAGLIHFDGNVLKATNFASATAGISVTRKGTVNAMPYINEIQEII